MSVIQFETVVEDNLIRIPERYIGQIPVRVSVTLVDDEPLDDEFDAILAKRVNITRELDL